jgi:hypothetical protein
MSYSIKTKIGSSKQKDGGGSGSNVTHCKVFKPNQGKNGNRQNKNDNSQAEKGCHKKKLVKPKRWPNWLWLS